MASFCSGCETSKNAQQRTIDPCLTTGLTPMGSCAEKPAQMHDTTTMTPGTQMTAAAKRENALLPETRVRVSNFVDTTFSSPSTWLSSTLRWGSGYRCDRTASGELDQRFYSSQFGRFMSADRSKQAAKANDSGSWNKYSYTRGDPVNRVDRRGLFDAPPDARDCIADPTLPGCGDDPGGGGPPPPTCLYGTNPNGTCFVPDKDNCDVLLAAVPAVANEACVPGTTTCVQNPVMHLFLVLVLNGVAEQAVDAGPPDQKPSFPPLGYLTAWVSSQGHYNELTNPAAVTLADTAVPCSTLGGLIKETNAFPTNIPYLGVANNSNAFAYTLSIDWGLATPTLSLLYPGWGQYL